MASSLSHPEGRFYEQDFPEVDDIVVVQVKRIVDMGAYVDLLEYNNREGMMLLSELSKRRIRSVAKLLKVGRQEICMVIRADRDRGYVDLSKRRVEAEDANIKEEQFAKAKAVHGIMRHVANTHGLDLEDFCQKFSWPLYRKYGSAYDAYRKHINEEINVWNELSFTEPGVDLSEYKEKIMADIDQHLVRKLITSMLRFETRIDVSCNEYEGIEAIKRALNAGLAAGQEECEVKIKLIAHPTFVLNAMCREKKLGIDVLEEANKLIREAIEKEGGQFVVLKPPTLITGASTEQKDEADSEEGEGEEGSSSGSSESEDDDGLVGEDYEAQFKANGAGDEDDADGTDEDKPKEKEDKKKKKDKK